jgi:hypothetical protein
MKIVIGPEHLILDHTQYPVTFAALTAIKDYNDVCSKADKDFNKLVLEAQAKLFEKKEFALAKLKGELK